MLFAARYVAALAAVALMLFGLQAAMRVLGRRRVRAVPGRRLTMICALESTMLSPSLWVHVVRVGAREIVLAATPASVLVLGDLADERAPGDQK